MDSAKELKEVTYAVGAEYLYQDSLQCVWVTFTKVLWKVLDNFFSFGAGFKYNVVKVDVSYLFLRLK
jgi:hypothetical protein